MSRVESKILAVLDEFPEARWTASELAERCGYTYNGHFKRTVKRLVADKRITCWYSLWEDAYVYHRKIDEPKYGPPLKWRDVLTAVNGGR